jgi:uncharacterized membrane protein
LLLDPIAHFIGMRADLIAMVPDWLPAPAAIVTITGFLELAAAAAMIHRRLATLAAAGLTLLLLAMFPANINLALSGQPLPWWDELVPRTIMQALFLAADITVAVLTHRPACHSTEDDVVPAGTHCARDYATSKRNDRPSTAPDTIPHRPTRTNDRLRNLFSTRILRSADSG